MHTAVTGPGEDIVVAVDNAVGRVDLGLSPPAWWRGVGVLQFALTAAALGGAGWLFAIGAIQLAGRLPPDVGTVAGVPAPIVLFTGALAGGAALAAVSASVLVRGAKRRREAVSARLHAAVHGIADSRIINRVQTVLDRHRTTREALASVDTPMPGDPAAPEPAAAPGTGTGEPDDVIDVAGRPAPTPSRGVPIS